MRNLPATVQQALQAAHITESTVTGVNFDAAGACHDWRNYITDSVRECWELLPLETRLMMALVADVAAEREEWD